MNREPLTQRVRFEVFKRDSFTCQYCGAKAPDVVLNADHIVPVAHGGTNDILNLVTACFECNSGKGAVRLADDSVLEKSRKQAEILQQRREQIEMIAAWYRELSSEEDLIVSSVSEFIPSDTWRPSDHGMANLKKWAKKYGFAELIESTKIAFEQYFRNTQESWEKSFTMIPRIAHIRRIQKKDPALAEAYRLRGILRYRFERINYSQSLDLLVTLLDAGDLDGAETICRTCTSWTNFVDRVKFRLHELRANSSSNPN